MKRLLAFLFAFVFSALACAQSLTTAQLTTVRTFACADTGTARPMVLAGDTASLRAWLNATGTFVVWRKAVPTPSIGPVLNYVAVSNLTTANRDRATTFVILNPATFDASQDIADYWDTTFGGTLGGQGATVRAALQAHWRRNALRVEQALSSGSGTTGSPGVMTFEGAISEPDTTRLVFTDSGVLIGC